MALVPAGVAFDVSSKALSIDGVSVKIYYFADDPTMPWFFAKPIHTRLGATKIGHTLKRVSASRKSSLGDLIKAKGQPQGGSSDDPPLNQNDKKAIYVNEYGLYDVMLGSQKEEAVPFREWVTGVVLPSLRRTGTYSVAASPVDESSSLQVERQLAQLEREEDRKRQRHEEEMTQLREEREQKRLRHEKEMQRQDKELAEISARSAQQVDQSYFARLAAAAKALEDGLIDQAEHDRVVQAIRPKRADAVTIYEYVTKILRGDAKRVAAVEREMKRLVESGQHRKPAAERDGLGRILYFSGPDGPEIARVYQTEVDKQNRVAHGQQRLTVTTAAASSSSDGCS